MKRSYVVGLGLLGLWGLVGCTPAGSASKDDSFSLPSAAAERNAGAPTGAPIAASKPGPEKAPSGDGRSIVLGEKWTLVAPAHWVPKTPAMQMIAYEFAVPAVAGDAQDGRVTVMTAGGTVEANIARWAGQFSQPDGSETKAKTETKTVAGQEVHLVDLAGTYKDSRGPFSPMVERADYRMLAAIIPASDGAYFIKFYGPKKTVSENEQAFRSMIEGMK